MLNMNKNSISGRVVHAQRLYRMPRFKTAASVFLRVLCLLILSPIIIGLAIGFAVAGSLWRMAMPGGRRSFVSRTASQFFGYYLAQRMLMPPREVPVRDFRIRVGRGRRNERLVRVQGHVVVGDMRVGDQVRLTGVDRHGTLYAREGVNYTTRSKIVIRPR